MPVGPLILPVPRLVLAPDGERFINYSGLRERQWRFRQPQLGEIVRPRGGENS